MYKHDNREFDVRLSEKPTLSIYEAAAYTGIGIQKLAKMAEVPGCDFVLYVGSKRMFKRKKLEEYLESRYSV
jgi:excisionase family DNA binding protein